MTELKTSHYLKQRPDGRIEPYKPIVNKSDAIAGHVLTADGAGNADYAASIADPSGAGAGQVFTADGVGGAAYQNATITKSALANVSLSGLSTSITTGIPSGAKRLIAIISGLSLSVSTQIKFRFGNDVLGAIDTGTNYTNTFVSSNGVTSGTNNNQIQATGSVDAASVYTNVLHFEKNTYDDSMTVSGQFIGGATTESYNFDGSYTPSSGNIDRVEIFVTSGTFDAGNIAWFYE